MSFLVVFGFELASVSLLNHLENNLNLTELPFDSEEEEEKNEKEKEFNERLIRPNLKVPNVALSASGIYISDKRYYCIPREIVTPPPEHQS